MQQNLTLYGFIIALFIIICGVFYAYCRVSDLNSQIDLLKTEKITLEVQIRSQNEMIDSLHRDLKLYGERISENNATYTKRLNALQKKIKTIKNDTEAVEYLRSMLNELR